MASISSVGSSAGIDRWKASQSDESVDEDFSGAVAAADLVAASGTRPDGRKAVLETAAQVGVPNLKSQKDEGQVQALATGKIDRMIPRNAGGGSEASSLIQKMAVSSNTGVDIAGLKPWSPDWVFEGGMNKHPLQKTLVEAPSRGESAGVLEGLEKLLQQANATTVQNSDEQRLSLAHAGQDGNPDGQSMKSQSGMNSLASADFMNVRQSMQPQPQHQSETVGARQAKSAVGSEQALAVPGAGLKAPNAIGEQPGLKEKKSKLPDTLGLISPQQGKPEMGSNVIPFQAGPNALRLDGAVVPGSLSQSRLSSESVAGITQSIRQLANGGEMRIRLKPDHLGELHMRVSTGGKTGSEVGLQIHASDDRAKRILEESMSSLREGLASQNLSLAKVDVQVAPSSNASNSGNDPGQDRSGTAAQQNFSSNSGSSGRRDGTSTQDGLAQPQARTLKPQAPVWSGGGGGNRAVASNRLDVIA